MCALLEDFATQAQPCCGWCGRQGRGVGGAGRGGRGDGQYLARVFEGLRSSSPKFQLYLFTSDVPHVTCSS